MKFLYEIDSGIPDTVRISSEWRATFRLSRFADLIQEVHIQLRPPQSNRTISRFECRIRISLHRGREIVVQEHSDVASLAASTGIDRASSAVGRFAQRQARNHRRAEQKRCQEPFSPSLGLP